MSTCYIETLNKLSSEIIDLMRKMVDLKIHINNNLDDHDEESVELAVDLFYDMLDVKIKSGRKLRDMKVIVDIEPDLLVCDEVELTLKNAEENCKLIYEMYNDATTMFKAKFTK